MDKRSRSKNPDLLLPEVMDERIGRITDFWDRRIGSLRELDRMTVFVTHRCNLLCQYCNGPHATLRKGDTARKREMLKSDLSVESFGRLLDEAQKYARIKHIHFTGGEPTLNRSLPVFVEMATARGILSSITTNGTARPELYRDLIKKGLTEIRISFDSDSDREFDAIVGVSGSFEKVVNSIRAIMKLRDEEKKDVFLVLNACIGQVNLARIEQILGFLISLNPNDIKLLAIAQDKEFILNNESELLIDGLKEALKKYPEDQFVLLRTKIDNLFNPNAVGLKDQEVQTVMRHCFIPMTERTIDGSHYYPCSIYLRYYGEPIGPLTQSFEEQQTRIMDFVRRHDCCQDAICSNHCTNCCQVFNLQTNRNLFADSDRVIKIKDGITRQETDALLAKVCLLLESGQPSDRPFLIIKPHGQQWRKEILEYLAKIGLGIESMARIENWANCAKFIYTWPLAEERARFTLEMEKAFQIIERGPADILYFGNGPSLDSLIKIKLELRKLFPTEKFQLDISGKIRRISLTVIHTPDLSDVRRENTILNALLKGRD